VNLSIGKSSVGIVIPTVPIGTQRRCSAEK
jgi:hypothetical protein